MAAKSSGLSSTAMTSTAPPAKDTSTRPPAGGRLPSLNQLAARINSNSNSTSSSNNVPAAPATEKKSKVGYKNIPSLDAITARLAKARAISVDGSAKPPDAEMIEDPKTPGIPMKAPEHPLQFPWYDHHLIASSTASSVPFSFPGRSTTTPNQSLRLRLEEYLPMHLLSWKGLVAPSPPILLTPGHTKPASPLSANSTLLSPSADISIGSNHLPSSIGIPTTTCSNRVSSPCGKTKQMRTAASGS